MTDDPALGFDIAITIDGTRGVLTIGSVTLDLREWRTVSGVMRGRATANQGEAWRLIAIETLRQWRA